MPASSKISLNRSVLALALLATGSLGVVAGALWSRPGTAHTRTTLLAQRDAPQATRGTAASPSGPDWTLPTDDVSKPQDPAARQSLLQQYADESDPDKRDRLLRRLGELKDDAQAQRFALDLLGSRDPASRLRAIELLDHFPLSSGEVRSAIVGGLQTEKDPQVLAALVNSAEPYLIPTEDAGALVGSLKALTTNADPQVRAASTLQAAQWVEPGEAEGLLSKAIVDEAPQVRRAAVSGVISTSNRSPQVKDALLWMVADAGTDGDTRAAAVFALQNFRMNRQELEIFRKADHEVAATMHE